MNQSRKFAKIAENNEEDEVWIKQEQARNYYFYLQALEFKSIRIISTYMWSVGIII